MAELNNPQYDSKDIAIPPLKPCPFCGEEAELRAYTLTTQFIQCKSCGAGSNGFENSNGAIAAWNKRYTLWSSIKKVVRKCLKKYLED